MKLKTLYLKNFRCFKNEVRIEIDNLTTFIGKNDIGKSTILEALEIFFNNDTVKIEKADANIYGGDEVEITCEFCDLPPEIILDSGEKTSLKDEFLTISEDLLRIKKVYDCSKSKISSLVYIVANHPSASGVSDLLSLKEKDLQKLIKDRNIDSPLKGNPKMRKAIWNSTEELKLEIREIEVSKAKEDSKDIWSKIETYLPNYALFQSDRGSHDSDGEVQNPMKAAIQQAISEVETEIVAIQDKVKEKALAIANETKEALKTIDAGLANELTPQFAPPTLSKWSSLFSISMDTDEGIALNKRGSGVRRMILVGFFKSEAERRLKDNNKKNIIYAIEEPETAQHPNKQRILINSFKDISNSENAQVILTTHSPGLASELPTDSLRFIDRDENGEPEIKNDPNIFPLIAETLGILPDANRKVQVILCLEGPTDVIAFKALSRCLREKYPEVVDLEKDERVLVVPLGGSTLKHWVEQRYFKNLNCPEVHIYDSDVKDYQLEIDKVCARNDGSWGAVLKKREIENYLHPKAIKAMYDVDVDTDCEDVPSAVAVAYYEAHNGRMGMWRTSTAKDKLSKVFENKMNFELLQERDPAGEVKGWFDRIKAMLQ